MFRDVFQRVRDAENRVDEAEIIYDKYPILDHHAQTVLNPTLSIRECFW